MKDISLRGIGAEITMREQQHIHASFNGWTGSEFPHESFNQLIHKLRRICIGIMAGALDPSDWNS